MSELQQIEHLLYRFAERAGDPVNLVFDHYQASDPEARALLCYVDRGVLGQMLEEVFRLMLTPANELPEAYLQYEARNHRGYGVRMEMYARFMASLTATMQAELGAEWTEAEATAWHAQVTRIIGHFETYAEALGEPEI